MACGGSQPTQSNPEAAPAEAARQPAHADEPVTATTQIVAMFETLKVALDKAGSDCAAFGREVSSWVSTVRRNGFLDLAGRAASERIDPEEMDRHEAEFVALAGRVNEQATRCDTDSGARNAFDAFDRLIDETPS